MQSTAYMQDQIWTIDNPEIRFVVNSFKTYRYPIDADVHLNGCSNSKWHEYKNVHTYCIEQTN